MISVGNVSHITSGLSIEMGALNSLRSKCLALGFDLSVGPK